MIFFKYIPLKHAPESYVIPSGQMLSKAPEKKSIKVRLGLCRQRVKKN